MKNTGISNICRGTFFAFSLTFVTIFVNAQSKPSLPNPASLAGAEGAARGGSIVASEMSYSSLIGNPAGAAFNNAYEVGLGYVGAGNSMRASIVDNKSSFIGGGLYYLRRDTKKGDISTKSVGNFARVEDRVGLSFFGKAANTVALGVGAKWARRTSSPVGVSNETNINVDLGALAHLDYGFSLGGSVVNLLDDENGLNPRAVHFGLEKEIEKTFLISADASFIEKPSNASVFALPVNKSLSWAVGSEYSFGKFKLRAGYREDLPWDERWLAGGLAYVGEKFSLHYALEGLLKGLGQSNHNVGVDVRF